MPVKFIYSVTVAIPFILLDEISKTGQNVRGDR